MVTAASSSGALFLHVGSSATPHCRYPLKSTATAIVDQESASAQQAATVQHANFARALAVSSKSPRNAPDKEPATLLQAPAPATKVSWGPIVRSGTAPTALVVLSVTPQGIVTTSQASAAAPPL
jgi:hypothetical protein